MQEKELTDAATTVMGLLVYFGPSCCGIFLIGAFLFVVIRLAVGKPKRR